MNEENLALIFDKFDEGIHVVDLHGNTVYYNKAMGQMEGAEGKNTLWQVLQTHVPMEDVSESYLNQRGEKITIVHNTYPLYVQGELWGAFKIAKDLSKVTQLTEQVVQMQSELHPPVDNLTSRKIELYTFEEIVTQDEAMFRVLEKAKRAANTGVSVLITGETGTGKEMVAQSIHTFGARARGPFVAQNCAALPESLLEGILFGTVRGSFTGAIDRPGLFEQAQGGTILLDEIDSMGLNLQAKILRVLQEGKIRRLGDVREKEIGVRIAATTNQPPQESVRQGRIRSDLYYRLNVLEVTLPPLRERQEDIELLAQHFLRRFAKKHNLSLPTLTTEVLLALKRHDWPGNVRELAHVIEGGLVISDQVFGLKELPNYLQIEELTQRGQGNSEVLPSLTLQESVHQLEISMIRAALKKNHGNLTQAAKHLGISLQLLQYKMRSLNV